MNPISSSPNRSRDSALGRTFPEQVLGRILYASQFIRSLDQHGYVRFRNWRLYAERGLVRKPVTIWIYTSTLKVEFEATDLSLYTVEWEADQKHIREVTNSRVIQTRYQSPQLILFDLGPDDWLLFLKVPPYVPRKKRKRAEVIQLPLLELAPTAEAT